MRQPKRIPDFSNLVRDFFCDRLINQQNVSPHTVAAFRDTFRLLLAFLGGQRRSASQVPTIEDLDAPTVLAFLDSLEAQRGNCVRTRNARLTAIRAFVTYAASRDPTILPLTQRVRAIPRKRFDRPLLGHLNRDEIEAILAAPDTTDWSGCQDRAMFTVMYNTGARVSEAIGLCRGDITIGPSASVRIHGKGRKDRSVPLWKATTKLMNNWLTEIALGDQTPLFPNRHGHPLSRSGVEDRLDRAVLAATIRCPSLRKKNVSPHTLRMGSAYCYTLLRMAYFQRNSPWSADVLGSWRP